MNCDCRWTETIFGIIILVVSIWPGIFGAGASRWIVIVAAALLVLHAWTCKTCSLRVPGSKSKKK